jgi:Na+/H+ antiporter NhaD/arsenite permease-like protein
MVRGAASVIRANPVLIVSILLALISMAFVPPSEKYIGYIDAPMLCILFCLMASVAGMSECGLFRALSEKMVGRSGSVRGMCLALVAAPFFGSMAMTNDVALITFVPLAMAALVGAGRKDLIMPVLILQTLAANLGSMATPVGSPQNLFIYSKYGADAGDFLARMLPLVLAGGAAVFGACAMFCKGEGSRQSEAREAPLDKKTLIPMAALFVLGILAVSGTVPFWLSLIVTLATVLAVNPPILRKVDYGLILTFVFLFVFTGNFSHLDQVVNVLGGLMEDFPVLTTALSSQAVSNVPAAMMLSNFTSDWGSLLAGANIGGFGTPIASMASLITFRIYSRGERHDSKGFMVLFLASNLAMLGMLLAVDWAINPWRRGDCGGPSPACSGRRSGPAPPKDILPLSGRTA